MSNNKLAVAEIFYSIQGEGKFTGTPAVFLRLAGCNLVCGGMGTQFDKRLHNGATWRCDTMEVWLSGKAIPISDLIKQFYADGFIHNLEKGAHLIITGGEPLLQEQGIIDFLDTLKKEMTTQLMVEIETNGTLVPSRELVEKVMVFNLSPKLANSGNTLQNRYNAAALTIFGTIHYKTIWKFVVSSMDDWFEIEKEFLRYFKIPRNTIYLMPACETIEEYCKAAPMVAEICKDEAVNFSSRLQVTIWDKTTGV